MLSSKDKALVAWVAGGFFIVSAVGIFIQNNFDWYVGLLYWLFVFGGLALLVGKRYLDWKEKRKGDVIVVRGGKR